MIKLRKRWVGASAALLIAGAGFGITTAAVAAPSPAPHHSSVTPVGGTGQAVDGRPGPGVTLKRGDQAVEIGATGQAAGGSPANGVTVTRAGQATAG